MAAVCATFTDARNPMEQQELMSKHVSDDSDLSDCDSHISMEDSSDVEDSIQEPSCVSSDEYQKEKKTKVTEQKTGQSAKEVKKHTTPFSVLDILGPSATAQKTEGKGELLHTKAHGKKKLFAARNSVMFVRVCTISV